jgi:uncharacterized membrane protein YphA (DoxX/SURF4 family)
MTTIEQPQIKTGTNAMLVAARVARWVVGWLFIFSGLIKINDPVGTQIKFEEYFEVFAQDLPWAHGFFMAFVPFALPMSVFFCASEVILGVALLARFRPKMTSWLLLLLVTFFTFLTFYSAYFNRVTDCGCFGDAIKLKPWTSFTKDVVLVVLILYIIGHRNRIMPRKTAWLVVLSGVASVAIGLWAILYLPPLDLLPYAVGKNITTQMQPSEPLKYRYVMVKDGNEQTFDQFPTDTTFKFKEMQLLNEGAKPKITDYRLWDDASDFTVESLKGRKLFVIVKDTKTIDAGSIPAIRSLVDGLRGTGIQPIMLTSVSDDEIKAFRRQFQLEIPYYKADGTVLKTIMRTNPGTWLLRDGNVVGKWSYNTTPDVQLVNERMSD